MILNRQRAGAKRTFSRSSRTWSTPLLEAPSISRTSSDLPSAISMQMSSSGSKSMLGPLEQLSAFAMIRAVDVLPVPRGPTKRYACARRSCSMAFLRVLMTWSCPRTSWNVLGRYFLANT